MTSAQVRVLLVIDRPSVRLGLQTVLEANPGIVVVAAVNTMAVGVSEARRLQPDVLVVDEHLGSRSGVEVCRAVRDVCPVVRALLLVSSGGDPALAAVFLAGAAGYVLRDLDTTVLEDAVLAVGRGYPLSDVALAPAVLRRLYRLATDGCRDRDVWNSPRLADSLLELIGEGLSDQEISERLDVPAETIRDAVKSLAAMLPVVGRRVASV